MSVKILVPLADGFEEIEAVAIIDVLRRAELEVVTAGLEPGAVEGAHMIRIEPDDRLVGAVQPIHDMDRAGHQVSLYCDGRDQVCLVRADFGPAGFCAVEQ